MQAGRYANYVQLCTKSVQSGVVVNPLAHTAVRETAELAKSVNTQPAVRRSEPSISCF
jgi:hypothetical protein